MEWLNCLAVGNARRKPIIGILGGIGSGKSTVAAEFAKLGCTVIDADKIAHELLDQPEVRQEIVALFGEGILDSAGKIDHKKLSDVIFADAQRLLSLNKIIHPLVLKRVEDLIGLYKRRAEVKGIVLDIPLLVEVGWTDRCDKLIFVDCRRHIRIDRVKKMGIFDENQLKIRENFQISLDKKAKLADNIVDNNSDFSALVRQAANIFSHISCE
jgi:dephospho-CoA kinase